MKSFLINWNWLRKMMSILKLSPTTVTQPFKARIGNKSISNQQRNAIRIFQLIFLRSRPNTKLHHSIWRRIYVISDLWLWWLVFSFRHFLWVKLKLKTNFSIKIFKQDCPESAAFKSKECDDIKMWMKQCEQNIYCFKEMSSQAVWNLKPKC